MHGWSGNSAILRRFISVLFLSALNHSLHAQGEANIWYFGNHAGYDLEVWKVLQHLHTTHS